VRARRPDVLFSPQSTLKLRLRLQYAMDGQPVQDQFDFAGFPANVTTGGV
jgi:AP-1 complex subunit gamma-1